MKATIVKPNSAIDSLIRMIETKAEELGVLDEVLDTCNLQTMVGRNEAIDIIETARYNRSNPVNKTEDTQMLVVDRETKETINIEASEVAEFTTVAEAKAKATKVTATKAEKEPKPAVVEPLNMSKLNSLLDKRAALAKQLEELDAEIANESEGLRRQQAKAEASVAPKVAVVVTPATKAPATKAPATKTKSAKTSHTTKVIRATAKDKGIDLSEFNFRSSIDRAKAALKCGLVG
jgi:hypothetical protein